MKNINWGIIGCGAIAQKFAQALNGSNHCTPYAAAARDGKRAADFARKWGFTKSYGSYREMVQDKEVDIVYIATPHSYHYAHVKLCLEAGRHVLCEKPFTVNAEQLKVLIDLAANRNLFLMEALWSRFLPGMTKAKELVEQGVIGEVVLAEADFGLNFPYDPEHRLYNPLLAGGALLDLGIYPLFLSLHLFGKPEILKAHSLLDNNGIDLTTSMITQSKSGAICNLISTVRANTPIRAKIIGTKGTIEFDNWWFTPVDFTLCIDGKEDQIMKYSPDINGFEYEIEEAVRCLQEGKTESPIMSHDFSLLVMETMDDIRKMTGITYPQEIEQIDEPYGWKEL
ncbi:MAG: Gfo/Idh/MocA family oxidoreductase [Bacteroidales bacterium]